MDDLAGFVRAFENAEDVTRDARAKSEKCQDYFDDKQLTADEEAELTKRGQPAVVFNEIKPKIKTMLGLEKQTRKDPHAFPRNPDDEDAAQAATDAIRYVCEDSRWDDRRSNAAKDLAIKGTGAVFVGVKKARNGIDPEIRKIAWDRFYADPHSSDDDFEDAQFLGSVIWMDMADAQKLYPKAKDEIEATWLSARDSDTYDDKPKHNHWADYTRKRVRLCEHYYRDDGVWKYCIFTKGGFLVEPTESPYMGEEGPECPIKAISLYIDRDNNRYGEVQAMLSPQDEINKRRSKSLHVINTRQLRLSPNVGMSADAARKELARPDGVFHGEKDDVEVLETNDMAVGNLNLMMDAREHIHRTGANSALAGKDTESQSGRAIIAQQQGGMTEAADFLDCIRRLSMAVYRSVWCRVRQHWKEERWIRVTDNDKNVKFVGLNRQMTLGDAIKEAADGKAGALQMLTRLSPELAQALQAAIQGDPQAQALVAQVAQGPKAQMPAGVENNVGELDVDIMVDEGIDTPTIAAEQFDTIVKTIPAFASLMESQAPMAQALLKVVVQSSQLRDKDKLLEILEPKEGQGQAAPSPEEMMAAQMQAAEQQMMMEGQIETQKAQIKAQSDMEVAKIKALTDIEVAKIKIGADAEAEQVKLEADTSLNERRMMLEHESRTRVAEATGEATKQKAKAEGEASDKASTKAIMDQLTAVITELARPKTKVPIRDENGLLVGIREEAA